MTILTILIGAAGSGKSTVAAEGWKPTQIVSSDSIRAMICDNPSDQSASRVAFRLLHIIVTARLQRGLDTVVDATSAHENDRAQLLDIARETGMGVTPVAVVMRTSLEECLRRNRLRPEAAPGQAYGRRVPEVALTRQFDRIQRDLPGLKAEGFAEVIFVDSRLPEVAAASGERQRHG